MSTLIRGEDMSNRNKKIKDKINKKVLKNIKESKLIEEIPDSTRVALGKFYLFSIIFAIIVGIIYPFILINHFDFINLLLVLIVLYLFYIFIIFDTKKKKGHFSSVFYIVFIFLNTSLTIFSLIKLLIK